MMLLTKALRRKLPPLYSNEDKGLDNSMAIVKFFTPWSNWTWWASEASAIVELEDGETEYLALKELNGEKVLDIIFFGLVSGFEVELGNFSLKELESVRGLGSLKIERDLYFEPTSLQVLMDKANKERHR